MANRGGPRLKEYRTAVTSIKQWQSEIAFPSLSIVEVYSSSFGQCQVILPIINTIMMNTDNSESSIHWLTVNISKIEEEQRQATEAEQKKAAEMQSQLVNKRNFVMPSSNSITTNIVLQESKESDSASGAEEKENGDGEAPKEDGTTTDIDATGDAAPVSHTHKHGHSLSASSVTIPLLESYHNYDHPRPLWLFFVNGELRYELTSANPPKMTKLVQACLSGTVLSETELSNMELASDSKEVSEEKKRKRKLAKLLQEQEAARLKALEEAEAKKKKKEISRTPEHCLTIKLKNFDANTYRDVVLSQGANEEELNNNTNKGLTVVLSYRENESDDYIYHSQTDPLPVPSDSSAVVTFPKYLSYKKNDTAETESQTELKWAIYATPATNANSESGPEAIKGDRASEGSLGEVYVNWGSLRRGEVREFQLVYHDHTVPPLSPSAAKSPRSVPPKVDKIVANIEIGLSDRQSEGTLTEYRMKLNVDGLTGAAPITAAAEKTSSRSQAAAGEKVSASRPPSAKKEKEAAAAEEAKPATPPVAAEAEPSPLTFSLTTLDANAPVPVVDYASLPLSHSVAITHYSKMERQLTFTVKNNGDIVGVVSTPFSALLAMRAVNVDSSEAAIALPLTNGKGEAASMNLLVILEELDSEGNVIPFESANKKESTAQATTESAESTESKPENEAQPAEVAATDVQPAVTESSVEAAPATAAITETAPAASEVSGVSLHVNLTVSDDGSVQVAITASQPEQPVGQAKTEAAVDPTQTDAESERAEPAAVISEVAATAEQPKTDAPVAAESLPQSQAEAKVAPAIVAEPISARGPKSDVRSAEPATELPKVGGVTQRVHVNSVVGSDGAVEVAMTSALASARKPAETSAPTASTNEAEAAPAPAEHEATPTAVESQPADSVPAAVEAQALAVAEEAPAQELVEEATAAPAPATEGAQVAPEESAPETATTGEPIAAEAKPSELSTESETEAAKPVEAEPVAEAESTSEPAAAAAVATEIALTSEIADVGDEDDYGTEDFATAQEEDTSPAPAAVPTPAAAATDILVDNGVTPRVAVGVAVSDDGVVQLDVTSLQSARK